MDSLPLRSCLECQGVNGTRAGYPSQESHGRTGWMSGVSPCAAAGAGGAAVQAVASASGGGGRARSPAPRLSGRSPGRAWERAHSRAPGDRLGPASSPGVKGNRSRNWPSALTRQQAGPRPGRSRQKIPSRPTGDPRQGRWSSRSAPMSRAAPHGDLQRRCHSWALAAQNSHTFFRGHSHPRNAPRRKFRER